MARIEVGDRVTAGLRSGVLKSLWIDGLVWATVQWDNDPAFYMVDPDVLEKERAYLPKGGEGE